MARLVQAVRRRAVRAVRARFPNTPAALEALEGGVLRVIDEARLAECRCERKCALDVELGAIESVEVDGTLYRVDAGHT